jgi:hypothetical protein
VRIDPTRHDDASAGIDRFRHSGLPDPFFDIRPGAGRDYYAIHDRQRSILHDAGIGQTFATSWPLFGTAACHDLSGAAKQQINGLGQAPPLCIYKASLQQLLKMHTRNRKVALKGLQYPAQYLPYFLSIGM